MVGSGMAAGRSIDGSAPRQLLAYRFPPGMRFEGRLSTALQRIESGGALTVLSALFVGRLPETGELVAMTLQASGSAGIIGQLVGFRLDGAERARQTQEALAGPSARLVAALGEELEPGHAVAAMLVEHSWAQVMADAVAGVGGTVLADELLAPEAADGAWEALPQALRDG
jgi:hypothetical protein